MNFSKLYFALSIIILIVAVSPAQSATIHVPADQPTIQAGIDAAVVGDTVLVADGTYTGPGNKNMSFEGKNIVLKSENGPEVTRIVSPSPFTPTRGFVFESGEDTTAIIDGFTIAGFRGLTSGGAISCISSSPSILNNIIEENSTVGSGGGINCTFNSNPRIINNIIAHNSSPSGGGITCINNSNSIITGNTFIGNSARWGGAIYCNRSSPMISNNTIVMNSARQGGALFSIDSSPMLDNCIIAFNSDTTGAVFCPSDSFPVLSCTNVYGNSGGDWVDCIASQNGQNGNFSSDPLFCDTSTFYFSLRDNSPCAPANNSCGVLIGALDVGCGLICADANGDSMVNVDDVDFLIDFYFYGGATPFPYFASDLNCDGSVNIADITYLAAYINGTGAAPCCVE